MNKFTKFLLVVLGILTIAAGVYCMLDPELTYMSTVGIIVGITLLLDGIGCIYGWYELRKLESSIWLLLGGIASTVLGFFVLNDASLQVGVETFILYYISASYIVDGIIVVVYSCRLCKLHRNVKNRVDDAFEAVRDGVTVRVNGEEVEDSVIDEAFDNARENLSATLPAKIGKCWWLFCLLGLLTIASGVLGAINPAFMASRVGINMGLGVILMGWIMIAIGTLPTEVEPTATEAKE